MGTGGSGIGEAVRLRAVDGVPLAASHLAGPSYDVGAVMAHGFTGHHRKPFQAAVARRLARHAGVLAFDFRGHGGSGGLSTLGDREVLDVDAAVRAARGLGYRDVVTVGFSMGASAVLRHAALVRGVDAVVSVSAVSRWRVKDTVPMRRLHWMVEQPAGRRVSRHVFGTRIARGWEDEPESPVEVVGRIAPTPLLLVHGDRDAYFGPEHLAALRDAASEPTEVWLVPGFAHAESGATPELVDRIGRHLPVLLSRRS